MIVTADEVRAILRYEPDTGLFFWRENRHRSGVRAGHLAGNLHHEGYMRISVFKRSYLAHRLAWLMMTGEWPPVFIDHIDRNRCNNRFDNLRLANRSQNNANQTGFRSLPKGVRPVRSGRYQSHIKCNGKAHYLGTFDEIDAAHAAYMNAAIELFGEYASSGKLPANEVRG